MPSLDPSAPRHVPARMLNEWTYCPRLAVLEWVHGEFAHNEHTVEGGHAHRRVDAPGQDLPEPEQVLELEDGGRMTTRSVWLSSDAERITAKMDVVELEGGEVVPVDTKKGRAPDVPERAWEADRVQVCAQGLVLRDRGYRCERGYVYYAQSRRRVEVVLDEALIAETRLVVRELERVAGEGALPPPLVDSPKCPGCSLVGLCLPDETTLLARGEVGGAGEAREAVREGRQLLAPRPEGLPLYVETQGARVGTSAGSFVVTGKDKEKLGEVRVRETTSINLYGMVQVTTQALRAAMEADVPVCFFSFGGWFVGMAGGHPHKNVVLRQAQYAAASDEGRRLAVSRAIVRGKIRNQRTLLRRNGKDVPATTLGEMTRLADSVERAADLGTLLGLEGAAARLYFQSFRTMLKPQGDDIGAFDFDGRNRRPPRDPVNALLSYAYSLLTRDLAVVAQAAGFDPYLGLYHAPKYGKPALALDLMEEFRPLVADSVVVGAINNGEVTASSFYRRADGCQLTAHGRKAFLRAYERRMDQLITHPLFGYRVSWRRVLDVQTRLLGRHLLGEIPAYVPIETR